jgi:hypothetical protein
MGWKKEEFFHDLHDLCTYHEATSKLSPKETCMAIWECLTVYKKKNCVEISGSGNACKSAMIDPLVEIVGDKYLWSNPGDGSNPLYRLKRSCILGWWDEYRIAEQKIA